MQPLLSLHTVPALGLIFSCVEPSQELLSSSGPKHLVGNSHGRAQEDLGSCSEGDVAGIPQEESDAAERGKGYWGWKHWAHNRYRTSFMLCLSSVL